MLPSVDGQVILYAWDFGRGSVSGAAVMDTNRRVEGKAGRIMKAGSEKSRPSPFL